MNFRVDRGLKPHNALKRAEELIGVGHRQQACTVLHEVLATRRAQAKEKKHLPIFEQIMMRYIGLCVQLRETKRAKDGLHQYKSLCNGIGSMTPLATVIRTFLHLAEERTAQAQQQFDKLREDKFQNVEELLKQESKSSLLLLEVSGEGLEGRLERQLVTPWHKFFWDSFRCVLEILRNIPKLEALYHETARNALNFCVQYRRKNEFRRLGDMLRFHLVSLQKSLKASLSKGDGDGDEETREDQDLSNPETHAAQLETRYVQLTAACELSLWNEAYRAIEDIRSLLNVRVVLPASNLDTLGDARSPFVRKFTEKLTHIFFASQNTTFHAYFLLKYLDLLRPEERSQELCTSLLLATLSIELQGSDDADSAAFDVLNDQQAKHVKLATMLGVPVPPSRESLLAQLTAVDGVYNLTKSVVPELADLHDILETRFHPLELCQLAKPKLDLIAAHPVFSRYLEPLSRLVLIRLLQQLSQVYSKLKFSTLRSLAFFYDFYSLELAALAAVRERLIDLRFDHQSGVLHFNCRALASDDLRHELTHLARQLQVASHLIHPERAQALVTQRRKVFSQIAVKLEEEHAKSLERANIIEKRKEQSELLLRARAEAERRKQQQEYAARLQQQQDEAKASQIKLESERTQRKEQAQKEWRTRITSEHTPGLVSGPKPTETKPTSSDIDERREKIRKLREEKERIEARYNQLSIEVHHFERAKREEEAPLLQNLLNSQSAQDVEHRQQQLEEQIRLSKLEHDKQLAEKQRLAKMKTAKQQFEAALSARNAAANQALQQQYASHRQMLEQRLAEAKERKAREEEEQRKREEEKRAAEEAKEKERIRRVEEIRAQREKDEQVRLRREQIASAALARQDATRSPSSPSAASAAAKPSWTPPSQREPASPSRGVYVPPSRRTVGEPRKDEPYRRPGYRDERPPREASPPRRREERPPRDTPPRDTPPRESPARGEERTRGSGSYIPPRLREGGDSPARRGGYRDDPPPRDGEFRERGRRGAR